MELHLPSHNNVLKGKLWKKNIRGFLVCLFVYEDNGVLFKEYIYISLTMMRRLVKIISVYPFQYSMSQFYLI